MSCPAVLSVATSSVVTTLICSRVTLGTRSRWPRSLVVSLIRSALALLAKVMILPSASLLVRGHVASLTSVFRQTRAPAFLWLAKLTLTSRLLDSQSSRSVSSVNWAVAYSLEDATLTRMSTVLLKTSAFRLQAAVRLTSSVIQALGWQIGLPPNTDSRR